MCGLQKGGLPPQSKGEPTAHASHTERKRTGGARRRQATAARPVRLSGPRWGGSNGGDEEATMADMTLGVGRRTRHRLAWVRIFAGGLALWLAAVVVTFLTGNSN